VRQVALSQFTDYVPPQMGYDGVEFRNSGSVDLEVRIKRLRPGKPYLAADDEFNVVTSLIAVAATFVCVVRHLRYPITSAAWCFRRTAGPAAVRFNRRRLHHRRGRADGLHPRQHCNRWVLHRVSVGRGLPAGTQDHRPRGESSGRRHRGRCPHRRALLGIVGALVAIPVAAALQLPTQELLFPALDEP
jgi:hypothetical protein